MSTITLQEVNYIPKTEGLEVEGQNEMVGLQEVLDVVNASYMHKNMFPIMVGPNSINSAGWKVFQSGLLAVEGMDEVKPEKIANIFRLDNMMAGDQIHAPLSYEDGWTHWVCYTKTIAGNKYVKTVVRGIHPLRDYRD